jgi:type I restriction enzyme, R subunit
MNDENAITPEQQARLQIDNYLKQAGWVVQNYRQMDLTAGQGVAVREVALTSGHGSADYVLYVDRKAVGIVEAKKEGVTLTGVEVQSEKYSTGVPDRFPTWHRPLPFLYESTGEETRFTNLLDPDPRSRSVFTFHRPETLLEWVKPPLGVMASDGSRPAPPSFLTRLRRMPTLDTWGMRGVQIEAITNLEQSLAANKPRALVQMTMGSGKTYAAVAQSYRLVKFGGAKRVLFLVDRGNLGRQTKAEYDIYKTPDDGRAFTELYNVQHLSSNKIDPVAKVCVSTIQRLYSILKGEPEFDAEADELSADEVLPAYLKEALPVIYNPHLPPEYFDVIIVDECHRSIYGLWRQVVEYFDATIIGLTATPSKQTFGFFNGNLVMEYGYTQAVADNVAVDHDIYRIQTRITGQGSTIEKGLVAGKLNKRTRQMRWEMQDEDFAYTASQLDRSVVAIGQIRLIIQTFKDKLFTEIFPNRQHVPKTLIFAKDDSHAEDIVKIVREVFDKGNEFCLKITNKSHKPEELLQQFRTSFHPRVAVTVDMIATGTDIRPLEIVFFMRDVKSANYFEQMKGRGSRVLPADELQGVTSDAASKTRFVLIDAVGVTEREHTDSVPLERNKSITLESLLKAVGHGQADEETVSTLASKMARLRRQLTPDQITRIETASGQPFTQMVRALVLSVDDATQEGIARAALSLGPDDPITPEQIEAVAVESREEAIVPFMKLAVRETLLGIVQENTQVIDTTSQDEVLFAGASPEAKKRAAARVESFKEYISANRDEIVALSVLYSAPRGKAPTLKQLKELANKLAAPPLGLPPESLWEAFELIEAGKVKGKTATDRAADLVSLIRFTIGKEDELVPFAETVNVRFATWLAEQTTNGRVFTLEQVRWLEMMRDQVAGSLSVEREDLQDIPFTQLGGLGAAFVVFGDTLGTVIQELNEVLVS